MLELLLLSHFIADFPLQTNAIYAAKMRALRGVFWHVGVITLVNIAIMLPFITHPQVWYAIALIFVAHVVMDQTKVYITKKYENTDTILFFLIDQLVHVLTIVVAIQLFSLNSLFYEVELSGDIPVWLMWYFNHSLMMILSGLVVVTFAGGIILYFMTHKKQRIKIIFQYNYPQMFVRGVQYLAVVLAGWLAIGLLNHDLPWGYMIIFLFLLVAVYLLIRYGYYLTKNDGIFTDINYKFNIYFPLGTGLFILFMLQFIYNYM